MTKLMQVLGAIALSLPMLASAQLNPGQEHVPVGGGGDSRAAIENTGPGTFIINHTSISAVYLNTVPEGIKAGLASKDTSGKGQAHIARLADNPQLQGKHLCYNGVGSDWGSRSCAPLAGDAARVAMTVPAGTKNVTFALVPRIYDGDRPMAWASHAKDLRHQLSCPGLRGGQTDMASMLRADASGQVRPATVAEVKAYNPYYAKFCGIEGRDMANFSADQ
ncbi:MAG: hypothetical protein WBO92_02770 [Candidatus Moraniibacteriota bacterium]